MCHSNPNVGEDANVLHLHLTYKEQQLIHAHGDLHAIVERNLDAGIEQVARKLSTDSVTVNYAWVLRWLRRNGYVKVERWERAVTQ
jgi:hypothetical protein